MRIEGWMKASSGKSAKRAKVRLVPAVLLVCVALAAGGCAASPPPAATSHNAQRNTSAQSKPHASPHRATSPGSQKTAPGIGVKLPTKIDNVGADRKNVALTSCSSSPGGWAASGVAVNHGRSGTAYRLTVYFTDREATVIGTGVTTVGVAPKHVARWRIATHLVAQPGGTRCVLVGVAK